MLWNRSGFFLILLWPLVSGCGPNGIEHGMENQPKVKPMAGSDFFPDGRGARPPVEGTVARGHLKTDALLYQGKQNGKDSAIFPFPVTQALLERGQERYDIFCAVCHDRLGQGNGMVVRRGFPHPPSFHDDRLRRAPPGHFFDVITNGFGTMYPYADRIPAEDRWAIVAYIRALQLSRHAALEDAPAPEQARLEESRSSR